MTYSRFHQIPTLALAFLLASSALPATTMAAPTKKRPTSKPAAIKSPTPRRKAKPRKKPKAPVQLGKPLKNPPKMIVLGKLPTIGPSLRNRLRLTRSQQRFGIALYKVLAARPGNLVFSPLSIATALSMVHAGALGATAKELYKGLQLPFYSGAVNSAYRSLVPMLSAPPGRPTKKGGKPTPPAFQFTMANHIWTGKGFQLKKLYKRILSFNYKTGITQLNFKNTAESRATINKWVSKATQNKIKQLLSAGSIKPATQMLLTNAVYFKSAWKEKFHKNFTKPRVFWLDKKRKKTVATMHQKNWFSHKDAGTHHVIKLQYFHQYVSLYLLVPKKKTGLAGIEKALSSKRLDGWLSKMRPRYLSLYLPKFKFTSKLSMSAALQKLGVKTLFTSAANLSKIAKAKLKVGNVIHQAYLDVHEKGTEAAAATAITFMLTSLPMKPPPPIVLKADRPFLFVMRHEKTRTNLFVGRVVSP